MRHSLIPLFLLIDTFCACAQAEPEDEKKSGKVDVSAEEIFRAAGFTLTDKSWGKCGDPGTLSYQAGEIWRRGDFNADGLTDAIVVEGGSYCFGATGMGYTLVTENADGSWTILDERIGVPRMLETKGVDGWPDIEVGGPGFCFPILRWTGKEYALDRTEYEGAPCPDP